MAFLKIDPVEGLLRLQRDLDRYFDKPAFDLGLSGRGVFPPINVFVRDGDVVVRAEVPGVKPGDVHIEAERGRLTLKGERKAPAEAEGSFHRRERRYGSFSRTIRLPEDVDIEKAQASYSNGVLTLRIPRAEAAKPRRIEVRAA
jgi:HSP20 family protein